jgi:UDP-N-acetylmuramate--alanine ligase
MISKNMHIHFIGICGIGMSGIAKILLKQGFTISGCDQNIDPIRSQELTNLGCSIGNHQSSICKDSSISMIVRTSDVTLDHPEIVHATLHNIPIKLRAEILAEIMSNHTNAISIAGAHGKTTTTSLLSHIFLTAQKNPTIVVGGHIHQLGSNAEYGNGNYIIAEADESDRSFLLLPTKYAIVTNIDREHLGVFKDFDDIKSSFIQFMNGILDDGLNIICIDDAGIQAVIKDIKTPFITYGTNPQATFKITDIKLEPYQSHFKLYNTQTNQDLGTWTVSLPGHHNILNATSTIALSLTLGLETEAIKKALTTFQGVDRRFTFKGRSKLHGALIFDDYGHHPTEIEAILKVARNASPGRLIVAFQPQRFSRTKNLWAEFIETLANAPIDELIVTDIFPANEIPIEGITTQNLMLEVLKLNPRFSIHYLPFNPDGQNIVQMIESKLSGNDLLLFLGAGKINKLAEKLIY